MFFMHFNLAKQASQKKKRVKPNFFPLQVTFEGCIDQNQDFSFFYEASGEPVEFGKHRCVMGLCQLVVSPLLVTV